MQIQYFHHLAMELGMIPRVKSAPLVDNGGFVIKSHVPQQSGAIRVILSMYQGLATYKERRCQDLYANLAEIRKGLSLD
jgi:hypothetical protein